MGKSTITEKQVEQFPDLSFKWLLESVDNLIAFLQIVYPDIVNRIDFTKAQKLPESYITDILREQRTDVTYLAPFQGRRKIFILCIHIEQQSKPDKTMSYRMSLYAHLIWDKQRREWKEKNTTPPPGPSQEKDRKFYTILPIVFYTGGVTWKRLRSLREIINPQEPFGEFVPQYAPIFKSLKEISDSDLVANNNPFGWAMRLLKRVKAPKEEFLLELEGAVSCISRVASDYQWRKLTQYLVLLIRNRRGKTEVEELISLVESLTRIERKKEVKEMAMTSAQALRKEGALENQRENILATIQARFQTVPSLVSEKLKTIQSMAQLRRIFNQCLTANNFDEIKI
ncbi:Rpn family recombination-promoting nuclease/putative transposase [Candidatus Poribacteria bacterium]|nr:Rpn family recombination-promoting nuclease/putative transposase [Candidatus Poribacteria bacterium]